MLMGTPTIYYDVDDTLVMWPKLGLDPATEYLSHPASIKMINYGKEYYLLPHTAHIETLKNHKKAGFKIVVWTGGGEEWGREVVERLGLQEYVDVVLSKPHFYYDDKKVEEFMHRQQRVYIGYVG